MFVKKVALLTLLFLLGSCVFLTENSLKQNVNQNSFLNRFPENQKSIIIFKARGKAKSSILFCDQESTNDCRKIYVSNHYQILMLEPGIYSLQANSYDSPIFSRFKKSNKELVLLELMPREIAYLGTLSIRKRSNSNNSASRSNFEVTSDSGAKDDSQMIKNLLENNERQKLEELFANQILEINFLIDKYPEVKNLFKKRLIKAPKFNERQIDDENNY
ncbi:MAG: hypothetical protein K0R25_613 [Rickettsiaceae bacterium]|jgi:hypothetical protein|nr:hypothetical protein [Rickettsiaceae bacterium]